MSNSNYLNIPQPQAQYNPQQSSQYNPQQYQSQGRPPLQNLGNHNSQYQQPQTRTIRLKPGESVQQALARESGNYEQPQPRFQNNPSQPQNYRSQYVAPQSSTGKINVGGVQSVYLNKAPTTTLGNHQPLRGNLT